MSSPRVADQTQAAEKGDGPIGMAALPELDGREVKLCNADLAQLSRLVFTLGGIPLRFERGQGVRNDEAALSPAVWLRLDWSGLPLMVGASSALAEAVAQAVANVGLDQLGESGFDLFAQLMLSPLLPAGMVLCQGALARDRKSTRLNSSHIPLSRMPSSA